MLVHSNVIANAIKAVGTLVRVSPEEFQRVAALQETPLVVCSRGKVFSKSWKYLTSYKGLAFHCKSKTELYFSAKSEFISAESISIPEL